MALGGSDEKGLLVVAADSEWEKMARKRRLVVTWSEILWMPDHENGTGAVRETDYCC